MSKKATTKAAGTSPKKRGPAAFVSDQGQVQSALGQLISQFSQTLAFLRELVQNSLDAGSNRVEVTIELDPESGLNLITVSDTGDGMDRATIDEKLTRLFSSSKENDLTKVGKFGVGFVSVFSCKPEAVVVDTGRNGENWRIIFHPDHSFDRVKSEEQLEGTTVRVYLKPAKHSLDSLQEAGLETLQFWCKHCHCEIFFNGQLINQPFSLEKSFKSKSRYLDLFEVYHESSLVRMTLAVMEVDSSEFFQGFYNGGITLLESQKDKALDGLHFKIDSRYLEHTISRDQVEKDENYHKALASLQTALETVYIAELKKHLSSAPEAKHWKALRAILKHWPNQKSQFENCSCWPVYAPEGQTRLVSAQQLCRNLECIQSQTPTILVDKLLATQEQPILRSIDPLQMQALQAFGISVIQAEERYHIADEVSDEPGLSALQLCLRRVEVLLRQGGLLSNLMGLSIGIQQIWPGRWVLTSNPSPDLLVRYPKPGEPVTRQELDLAWKTEFVMLNVDHPLAIKLAKLASSDPATASLWLAQRLYLVAPSTSRDESPRAYSQNLKFIQKLYEQYAQWAASEVQT